MARKSNITAGFTLIEVLLALLIIAIGLTALMKATAQNVANTQHIKEKTISHWVAMQGVTMIQLGLIPAKINQDMSQVTKFFGQRWYWRANITQTSIKSVQRIIIKVSKYQAGPFSESLVAFRYVQHEP